MYVRMSRKVRRFSNGFAMEAGAWTSHQLPRVFSPASERSCRSTMHTSRSDPPVSKLDTFVADRQMSPLPNVSIEETALISTHRGQIALCDLAYDDRILDHTGKHVAIKSLTGTVINIASCHGPVSLMTSVGNLILTQTTLVRVVLYDQPDGSKGRSVLLTAGALLDLHLAEPVEVKSTRFISVVTEHPVLATVQGCQVEAGFEADQRGSLDAIFSGAERLTFEGMDILIKSPVSKNLEFSSAKAEVYD